MMMQRTSTSSQAKQRLRQKLSSPTFPHQRPRSVSPAPHTTNLEFNFNATNGSFRVERDWEEMLQTAASSSSVQGVGYHHSVNSDWLHQGEDIDQLFYGFEPSQGPPVTPVSTTSGSSSSSIGAHFSNTTKSRPSNASVMSVRKSPSPLQAKVASNGGGTYSLSLSHVHTHIHTRTSIHTHTGRFLMSPPPISRVLAPDSNGNAPISTNKQVSNFSPIAPNFSYDNIVASGAKISLGSTGGKSTSERILVTSPTPSNHVADLSFQSNASHSQTLSDMAATIVHEQS